MGEIIDLTEHPIHLGLGATAEMEPRFTGDLAWYMGYGQRHAEDGVEGRNVIPGGQSGITDSENFSDQAALWLANETVPVRYTVDEVLEGAVERITFTPAYLREL